MEVIAIERPASKGCLAVKKSTLSSAARTNGVVLRLLACSLVLGLAGCRIPDLCCPEPGPELPGDFSGVTTPDNMAIVGIQEFFTDDNLAELLTLRLAQNQELKIRNQEIWIANNEILSRRGAYLPFLSLGARGGMDRNSRFMPIGAAEDQLTYPGGGAFPDPLPKVGLGANLFWEIDIWRRLRNARDAAIQRYYEAVEKRNYLVTQLVAETAENYYELLSLDKRLEYLEQMIELQTRSLDLAKTQKATAQGTELGVQRFLAEVRKNESQKFIFQQQIIEVENKINFLVGRYPQPIERGAWDFIKLDSKTMDVGIPPQLLQNRRDVRAAERELAASGLDIAVARANFYPRLTLFAGVGYEAFSPRDLFDPGAFVANAAGELVGPVINRAAIRADYMSANARQLQAVYNYQRTLLNAFTEVVNNLNKVQNYKGSVALKQEQVAALGESVTIATDFFQKAQPDVEYMDVLFAQRDLLEGRIVLIETKQQQLTGIIRTYQALGGGYLVTTSGMEFAELFCQPMEVIEGEIAPESSSEEVQPAAPSGETIPSPEPIPPESARRTHGDSEKSTRRE